MTRQADLLYNNVAGMVEGCVWGPVLFTLYQNSAPSSIMNKIASITQQNSSSP